MKNNMWSRKGNGMENTTWPHMEWEKKEIWKLPHNFHWGLSDKDMQKVIKLVQVLLYREWAEESMPYQ